MGGQEWVEDITDPQGYQRKYGVQQTQGGGGGMGLMKEIGRLFGNEYPTHRVTLQFASASPSSTRVDSSMQVESVSEFRGYIDFAPPYGPPFR